MDRDDYINRLIKYYKKQGYVPPGHLLPDVVLKVGDRVHVNITEDSPYLDEDMLSLNGKWVTIEHISSAQSRAVNTKTYTGYSGDFAFRWHHLDGHISIDSAMDLVSPSIPI